MNIRSSSYLQVSLLLFSGGCQDSNVRSFSQWFQKNWKWPQKLLETRMHGNATRNRNKNRSKIRPNWIQNLLSHRLPHTYRTSGEIHIFPGNAVSLLVSWWVENKNNHISDCIVTLPDLYCCNFWSFIQCIVHWSIFPIQIAKLCFFEAANCRGYQTVSYSSAFLISVSKQQSILSKSTGSTYWEFDGF